MKAEIDNFYTENYNVLVGAAKKRIKQAGKVIEPESVVSSSYLYLISRMDRITPEEIAPMAMGFICLELSRSRSQTNLKEGYQQFEELPTTLSYNQSHDIILNLDVESFRCTLDRIDQIVFEVYYDKGIQTKRAFADHFNIDPSSALIYINKVKEKFKEYVQSKERI